MRPRNGPPEAVSTIESTVSAARPSRHWKSAECSLSTGSEQSSSPLPGGKRELAGGDEALLVRKRERDASLERPDRRREPREADDRVQDDVRLRPVQERGEVSADLRVLDPTLGRQRVELVRPRGERAHLERRAGRR